MNIRLLILDVDGTLTDGKIYMSMNGEIMKAFNIKDGFALARLREKGIEPVIITGRSSTIVKRRCEELGIQKLFQGVSDKAECLIQLCKKLQISPKQCAYIGDDINDIPAMQLCGISSCPKDAIKQVKDMVDIVMDYKGGEGAVREFCDYILDRSM